MAQQGALVGWEGRPRVEGLNRMHEDGAGSAEQMDVNGKRAEMMDMDVDERPPKRQKV